MQVVLLASGSIDQVPESLWMVRGRPFVDWQLDRFVASGARSLVMCVGSHGEQIETHVRRALDRGLTVGYSYAGEQQLGSGGQLRRAFARLEDEFVLSFGGRYLPFDYAAPLADLRAHPDALASLAVVRGRGNVAISGDWVSRCEGAPDADYCEYGAVALRRSVLSGIEDGAVWELGALLRKLARTGKMRAFVAPEAGFDVGGPELEQHLASVPHEL
jgi:N-acetyl-alpha-D-muramate 1-phosphate uridylyltransferase